MNEEKRKVNLEGILYNEDGTFKPLTAGHGNTSASLAHLRDTYMESEREYFEHLLAVDSIRNMFLNYLKMVSSADDLFYEATRIQTRLEYGDLETDEEKEQMKKMSPEERDAFHMKKLEEAEGLMCLLFAAARDKVKIKDLVLTPSSGGRSR